MRMTDIPFGTTDWSWVEPAEHPGETGTAFWRTRTFGEVRVRMVEYTPGYLADHWCVKGHILLCLEGVEAIKAWKFKPATREGVPVAVYYVLTVNFQVDDAPFGTGPTLAKLLAQNPEFVAHLRGKRYQEAAELLDRWAAERPADPAIPLARIYLLLEQGRLQEAWQEALNDRGSERYESLFSVGAFAGRRASDKSLDAKTRAEAVELGLQAETAAMAAREDGVEAILFKSWLLRTKAELTSDPAERQALFEELGRLRKRATELPKARLTGTAPETP